jgi:hypothetical protein
MKTFSTIDAKDYTVEDMYVSAPMSWELISGSSGIQITSPDELDGAIVIENATNDRIDFFESDNPKINEQTGTYEYLLHRSIKHLFYDRGHFFSGSMVSTSSLAELSDSSYVLSIGQNFYGDRIKPGSFELTTEVVNNAIYDDARGNLYCVSASKNEYIGNIFYTSGIAVIKQDTGSIQNVNLFQEPENLDNAYWLLDNVTVDADVAVAPDGTMTADKIVENTTTGYHRHRKGFVATVGATQAHSVYAKAAGRNWMNMSLSSGNSVYFNIANGTIGSILGPITGSIIPVGNSWYRCTVAGNVEANTTSDILLSSANGTISYTGDGTSGVLLWGRKLEFGPVSTTYFQTSSISPMGLKIVKNTNVYVDYSSDVKLQRHEVNVKITPNEFNGSLLNPSIMSTYSTNDSAIQQTFNNLNIQPSSGSATWNLYNLMSAGVIKPYITTIGLYNDQYELLAVAKTSEPIQRTFDTNQIFIIRFDT